MNKPELAQRSEPPKAAAVDYPAAHSMDSTWWAVDGEGHVAQVNTGEAGAMPAAAGEPADADLITLLAEAGAPFDCEDLFAAADGKLWLRDYQTNWREVSRNPVEASSENASYAAGYLLWLGSDVATTSAPPPPPTPSLIGRLTGWMAGRTMPPSAGAIRWPFVRLPVEGKSVIWLSAWTNSEHPTLDDIRALAANGFIQRGWVYQKELDIERFGLFGYELSTFDNWIAGPFERGAAPPRPLRLDDLPPAVRQSLNLCPLPDHDFRREPLLQPFEAGESFAWGPQWVSTTGRVYSTSQHGPDLPERIARGVASPPVVQGESSLRALASAYLSGEAGAIDVLNDYLEETGRPRLRDHAAPSERLDELLFVLLSPEERMSVECEMVEHVVPHSATPEIGAAARQATEAVRKWLDGQADEATLQTAASAALAAWMPDDAGVDEDSDQEVVRSRDNGVAWAAWALARRWPLVAARTARTVHPDELAWQMQLVLERL
jgi:hypothetical protein